MKRRRLFFIQTFFNLLPELCRAKYVNFIVYKNPRLFFIDAL